jgi:hypothetical protein
MQSNALAAVQTLLLVFGLMAMTSEGPEPGMQTLVWL